MSKDRLIWLENKLIWLVDQIIVILVPSLIIIWLGGLIIEAARNIESQDYSFFINYAHLSLTLFGFTLIGSIFEKKNLKNSEIPPIVKRLSHYSIVFLASAISFFILYSYSFLLGTNALGIFEPMFLFILFSISYLGLVYGLILLLITLYNYIKKL